jgi:hypothetical protein
MARGSSSRRAGGLRLSWLGGVPVLVALLLGPLLLPRPVAPSDVPLPRVDERAVEDAERLDRERAARARLGLPDDVRQLGQDLRDLNVYAARGAAAREPDVVRRELDRLLPLVEATLGIERVRELRAYQTQRFLEEVRAYARTGVVSAELEELGGTFVPRMEAAGWIVGKRCLMDDRELRVAYHLAWLATLGVESAPALEPSLDEQRVLYAFYLRHPHPSEASRTALDAARRAARTPADCAALDAGERLAAEAWRLERVDRLGRLDPEYPHAFARGVVLFRLARYEDSARAFQAWLDAHPDGPLAIRARNHLRAALDEVAVR